MLPPPTGHRPGFRHQFAVDSEGVHWELFVPWAFVKQWVGWAIRFLFCTFPVVLLCFLLLLYTIPRIFFWFFGAALSALWIPFFIPLAFTLQEFLVALSAESVTLLSNFTLPGAHWALWILDQIPWLFNFWQVVG